MFNLAIKLSVVGFIGAMSVPFIESFVNKLPKSSSLIDDMGVILQIVLASGMVYLLTKKAPALVSGLLNGSPQLSGSDMIGTIKSGANTAVNAAAAVAGQTGTLQAARAAARRPARFIRLFFISSIPPLQHGVVMPQFPQSPFG